MVIHILVSCFEFYTYVSFANVFFSRRNKYYDAGNWCFIILSMLCIMASGNLIIRNLLEWPNIAIYIFTVLFLLALFHHYNVSIKNKIFYVLILTLASMGTDIFVYIILVEYLKVSYLTDIYLSECLLSQLIISRMLYFIFIRIVTFFSYKERSEVPYAYWLILILVPVISIIELYAVGIYLADKDILYQGVSLVIVSGIFLLDILLFVIYDIVAFQFKKIADRDKLLFKLDNTRLQYQTLVTHSEELTKILHDTMLHYNAMARLLEANKHDELVSYLQQLSDRGDKQNEYIPLLPFNDTVNIILSPLFSEAKQHGILVTLNIGLSNKIPINDIDLCALFGNILENAIKACNIYTGDLNKEILVEIMQNRNKITIKIENTSQEVYIDSHGFCRSTKTDSKEHGYGQKIIADIVNSYNGNLISSYSDNKFTLRIMLFLDDLIENSD